VAGINSTESQATGGGASVRAKSGRKSAPSLLKPSINHVRHSRSRRTLLTLFGVRRLRDAILKAEGEAGRDDEIPCGADSSMNRGGIKRGAIMAKI